ncbi:1-deoxy-D-xylulose-5-phosphate synthase [Streptomyces sp. ODS05-4]|uniref:1-deoxy-D-xylulose-5-phosphate synthase n=1 Tax=Streptomyces sp. ODS05-4 TaxID=2944939 RepID=UPI00210A7E29|nr:1-deoxy-D-xylulose-5-phosphate synthase [Streptomyces sp. ODS05-4]
MPTQPTSPAAPHTAATTALAEPPLASLLARVKGPADLAALTAAELTALAAEIRAYLVDAVSRTGGHLGPNLGVVELTIALHRVFDSPREPILFDTGHQCYVHKLLTGRQDFSRLRLTGGLSGYPARGESAHDLIENSHASTVLSYADGLARADEVLGRPGRPVVAVVGDGALTGGMAWEALNNIAAAPGRPVVIVLNDNGRSYAPTVGALTGALGALRTGTLDEDRGFFASLGLPRVGPVDGHDIVALETALRRAREHGGPVVVHCVTEKGRGYPPAERDTAERFHAVGPIAPDTGEPLAAPPPDWTGVFAREMAALGAENPRLVALTAAMPGPVGLDPFARRFPDRVFDVGIAEQHAVGCAAGLAMGGLHPVVALYATFLNRAFDQLLMDVALHRLGVTFVLDRAGVTGTDGPSHNGVWDMSVLQVVPGLRIAAPRDAARLRALLREAVAVDDGPTLVRYPKGAVGPDIEAVARYGGCDVLATPEGSLGGSGRAGGADVLLVSMGPMAGVCLAAADLLATRGIDVTVVDPGWVRPVDPALLDLATRHRVVVTVEDNGRTGGAGAAIAQALRDADLHLPLRDLGVPARFPAHAGRGEVLAEAGLTAVGIAGEAVALLARAG